MESKHLIYRCILLWKIAIVCLFFIFFIAQLDSLFTRPLFQPGIAQEGNQGVENLIPWKIWQVYFPPPGDEKHKQLRYVSQWVQNAPGFRYTLMDSEEGERFIRENHFGPEILSTFLEIQNPGLKSDFLRYLLLWTEGGYYSDLDTKPVKPLQQWLSPELGSKVRLLIAPEHDDGVSSYGTWPHLVQICQWTIAAAPGHKVLERMIQRAMEGLNELAQKGDLDSPSNEQVMNATGPAAWTEIIFEAIKETTSGVNSYQDLSRLAEPTLFGDILLLPIDAFMTLSDDMRVLEGAGQHQLVHHDFAGAWKSVEEIKNDIRV